MFDVCGLRVSCPPGRLDKSPQPDTQGSALSTTAQEEGGRRAGPEGSGSLGTLALPSFPAVACASAPAPLCCPGVTSERPEPPAQGALPAPLRRVLRGKSVSSRERRPRGRNIPVPCPFSRDPGGRPTLERPRDVALRSPRSRRWQPRPGPPAARLPSGLPCSLQSGPGLLS